MRRTSTTPRSRTPGRHRRGGTLVAARALAAAGCGFLLAGCYTLSPVRTDRELAPGRFRVHLSDSGAARVAGPLGGPVTVIDGRLTGSTADEIVLLVPSSGAAGFGKETLYQELRLPKREIDGLERRQLDRKRTGLAVGGVAAVAGFLLYRSLSGESGGSPHGGPVGPTEARTPSFRLWLW
jgi:hypothetical protein